MSIMQATVPSHRWKRRILFDAAKASIPGQAKLRAFKRRLWPYTDSPDNSALAFRHGLQHIRTLKSLGIPISGVVLEFGVGWIPIIPLMLHVSGADHVIVTDIERLMDARTIERARDIVRSGLRELADASGLGEAVLLRRMDRFDPTYIVPWGEQPIADASVDIITSRAVLEHVPPEQLAHFLTEWRRIVRPDGIMAHFIDNSDHWEHQYKSLSRVNFLRWEDHDFWWRLGRVNRQDYVNRLRHSDYAAMFAAAGWQVAITEEEVDEQSLRDLQVLPLAARFRGYDTRDLAIITSYFVARRTRG